jgi:hypothetical protein
MTKNKFEPEFMYKLANEAIDSLIEKEWDIPEQPLELKGDVIVSHVDEIKASLWLQNPEKASEQLSKLAKPK